MKDYITYTGTEFIATFPDSYKMALEYNIRKLHVYEDYTLSRLNKTTEEIMSGRLCDLEPDIDWKDILTREYIKNNLVSVIKENYGVAYDRINDDNLRQVIRYVRDGHYCGYIGIPKDTEFFKQSGYSFDKVSNMYLPCHGGISYVDNEPPDVTINGDRLYIGFDHNHIGDGKDYQLLKEVFGKDHADRIRRVYPDCFSRRAYTFDDLLNEIDELAETINEKEKLFINQKAEKDNEEEDIER